MRIRLLFFVLIGSFHLAAAQGIYDMNSVTEVKIYFQESNWDSILHTTKEAKKRLIGDVIVNGKKYLKVGIRYKGNSSYHSTRKDGYAKLPFNIKIDDEIKDQLLPGGYGTLKLSNVFRDPSFVREPLSYEIARKYMPASKANFAKVFVNDEYLGVYHNVESVDDQFLEDHFQESDGYLVKCDPDWSIEQEAGCQDSDKSSLMYIGEDSICYQRFYEMKDDYGWKGLIGLTKTLNQEPNRLEEVLDIDRALWMLAFNNVLVNLDSYTGMLCHNYYLYQDTSGIFHPIVWDMNLSLGGFRRLTPEGQLTNEEMQTLSPFVHYKDQNAKRPLIVKLLANDLYRKIYMAHIHTILDENFTNGWYSKRASELQDFIVQQVEKDEQKFYETNAFRKNLDTTATAGGEQIIGIIELMKKRSEYLLSHPLFQKEAPVISEVKHEVNTDNTLITAKLQHETHAWLYYRYGTNDNFVKIPMHDDGTTGDIKAGDHVWSASFTHQKNAQYYIVAEGERVASLSPQRASHEFYSINANAATSSKAK